MKIIEIAIVITGSLPYLLLSIGIVNGKVKQSLATWILWAILDVIVVRGIVAQNGNPLLYLVFMIGTFIVAAFLLFKKQFTWGRFETFVVMLVAICATMLFTGGPYVATIAGTVALNVAGIPQIIATWKDPKSTSSTAYLLFTTSSWLSVIESGEWTVQDKLPQISSMIYCLIVALLSLRKQGV